MKLPLSLSVASIENPSTIRPDCILVMFKIENNSKYNDRQFVFNGSYILRNEQKILALDLGYFDAAKDSSRVSSCIVLQCGFVHFPSSTLKTIELDDRIITHTTDYATGEGIRTELVCTSVAPIDFGRRSQRRDPCANKLVNFDKDYRPMDIESGQVIEITDLIERLELIEEKLGIRFDGICARARKKIENSPPDYVVEVTFDVVGIEPELKQDLKATLSAYNSNDQLINTDDFCILRTRFIGIESCKIYFDCHQQPVRLRLYPKPW